MIKYILILLLTLLVIIGCNKVEYTRIGTVTDIISISRSNYYTSTLVIVNEKKIIVSGTAQIGCTIYKSSQGTYSTYILSVGRGFKSSAACSLT